MDNSGLGVIAKGWSNGWGWGAKTGSSDPADNALANYFCILKRAHQRGRGLGLKPGSDVFQVRKQRTPFHSTIPP